MKVILFGATGMVGQGALRECLLDPGVEAVLAVGRRATGESSPKLREIVVDDMSDLSPVSGQLSGYDACFFCLGISSAGMTEADYRRVTYDIAVTAAQILVARSPGLTFVFVSGRGADSTERGRLMWARVKGETENAILARCRSRRRTCSAPPSSSPFTAFARGRSCTGRPTRRWGGCIR